ncbi:MAG TPA: TrkA family potassium uptake protein [Sphingobacterium sp.]|nr:TrkA family potassium uptake protein [Sphingobacterium sp.]
MKYIVLGLGYFGRALATQLTEAGYEVIAADKNIHIVEQLKDRITHTVCLDSTDKEAVASLPLKESDAVIVAIGEDEGASLLTTALLKQLNVKRIIGRVVSDLQKTVLEAMQIEEFIMPEEDTAERLALRLGNIDIVDSFKVSEKYSIVETVVPQSCIGLTLKEANLTNKYKVLIMTTIKTSLQKKGGEVKAEKEASGIAHSDTLLEKDDVLVVFGEMTDIQKMMKME